MAINYRQLVNGLNLVSKTSTTSDSLGDLEVLSSTNKLYFHNGTVNSEILTGSSSSILTNKLLDDSTVWFVDTSDNTIALKVNAAGTTGTSTTLLTSQTVNRILTLPDATDTLVGLATSDILTNKTIDATTNTISNLSNSNLNGTAAITNANLALMAANTIKGNNTGSPSTPLDLTGTQVTAELDIFTSGLKGLVPASGGGTTNFLRADGIFAAPPDVGVTTVGALDSQTVNANGLAITGATIAAQSADATHPGMVNITTQTFAGAKTFSTSIKTPLISDNGAGLTLSPTAGQNLTLATSAGGRIRIQSPSGLDIQQQTTPAASVAGYNSLYFKSNDQLYSMNSAGQERPVGSGGGLGINFLTLDTSFQPTLPDNSNFEASVGNWVTYNNTGTLAQSLTNNSTVNTVDPARWFGQSFIATASASVNTVLFKLSKSGTISGNIFCEIYSDSAGSPGTVIGTSDAYDSSTLTGTATVTTFTFSTPPALTNGTTYYAVINVTSVTLSPGNAILVSIDSTNPYASGSEFVTLNSGASWTSVPANDLYFDIESTSLSLTLTGGTASIVMSQTTTVGEVLDGSASLKVVKTAVNSQNQGISSTANVPLGYRGQIISIQFPFKVISGSLVSGDLGFYIYDITNSQLITPTNNSVSSGLMKMTFAMPANTTQIRAGINFDTTSTSIVTYTIDDIVIGPQEVVFGPSMTDWNSNLSFAYTGLGTVTNNNVNYRIVGDTLVVRGASTVGTSSATTASILLPSGYVIDSSKLPANASGTLVGYAENINTATNGVYGGFIGLMLFYDGSITDRIFFAASSNTNFVKDNGSTIFNSGNNFSFEFSLPILGLSTNVVQQNASTFSISNYLANGTRVTGSAPNQLGQYRSYLRIANTQTYTETNGTPADAPSITNGIRIYTSGTYVGGDASNNPSRYEIFVGKGLTTLPEFYQTTGRTGFISTDCILSTSSSTGLVRNYDPTTGIFSINQNVFGGATNLYNGLDITQATGYTDSYFDVKVSEAVVPVQLNSTVAASYYLSTTTTFNNVIMDFDTQIYDTNSSVTTGASWKFTAPVDGFYNIGGSIATAGAANIHVNKNGSPFCTFTTTSGGGNSQSGNITLKLFTSDYISLVCEANTTTTGGSLSTTGVSQIQIQLLGR